MARRSQRLSSGVKGPAGQSHKRAASNTVVQSAEAKRSKTTKATPTKSQYFKNSATANKPGNDSDSEYDEQEDIEGSSASRGEASEFEDESEKPTSSEGEEDDEYGNDSYKMVKSRQQPKAHKGGTASPTIQTKGSTTSGELWRPGTKTGLGPGNQVVIKKPQARPPGNTPYRDETIHPNTLLFLNELKANNERQWLKSHDAPFRQAERDWHSFVAKLTERLIEIDDTVPELPVKDVIFRIYRDVRFTSDPTPYKPHFSAAWSRTGRKGPYAHYYVQISPNNQSFVASINIRNDCGEYALLLDLTEICRLAKPVKSPLKFEESQNTASADALLKVIDGARCVKCPIFRAAIPV